MRSDLSERDIPGPLRALVELYEARLAEVHFPGIDRETLAAAAARVGEAASGVERARQTLDEVQRVHDDAIEAFRRLGERALAYAEVYAEGDDALLAEIGNIREGLGSSPKSSPKAPARRRRKKTGADPELPLAAGGAESAEAAQRS